MVEIELGAAVCLADAPESGRRRVYLYADQRCDEFNRVREANFARRIDEAVTNCNQRKMREALEWCRGFMHDIYDGKEGVSFSADDIERIDAALSAPPRNCDVIKGIDADDEFEKSMGVPPSKTADERDEFMRENWFLFRCWLFAEAKGENDGN